MTSFPRMFRVIGAVVPIMALAVFALAGPARADAGRGNTQMKAGIVMADYDGHGRRAVAGSRRHGGWDHRGWGQGRWDRGRSDRGGRDWRHPRGPGVVYRAPRHWEPPRRHVRPHVVVPYRHRPHVVVRPRVFFGFGF